MAESTKDLAEIGDRIRRYLTSEIILDEGVDLTNETPLLNGLVDSVGLMELVSYLEDEFGVVLEYDEVVPANFHTVADIAAAVSRKMQGAIT